MSKLKLICNVPTILAAEEQAAIAADIYADEPTTETYANMLRARMVVNTKKIALTDAEVKELRKMYKKEIS
jgi:hypothetical protein